MKKQLKQLSDEELEQVNGGRDKNTGTQMQEARLRLPEHDSW